MKQNSLIAFGALVCGAFFAGASTLFVRLSDLGPIGSAFQRAFLAIPILWFWVILEQSRTNTIEPLPKRNDLLILLFAGIFFAGDLFFWHLSIVNTSVANATLFVTLAPIYVTFVMYFFFDEKPKFVFVIGVTFALVGSVFLIGESIAFRSHSLLGNIYGLITGIFFAAYLIAVSRVRGRLSTARVMYYSTIVTAIVLLPIALYVEGNILAKNLSGWVVLLSLALFSHVGGQGLIAYSLAFLPAPFSSVTLVFEVVSASLLGWVFLAETLSIVQWVGGAIIIFGIIIARKGS